MPAARVAHQGMASLHPGDRLGLDRFQASNNA